MTTLLVILLLAGCAPVSSFVVQHKAAIAGEIAFVALTTLDGVQTGHATHWCAESNPIIGECGERVPVPVYFPAVIALHVTGAIAVPEEYRAWWIGVPLGVEAGLIWESYALGWRP